MKMKILSKTLSIMKIAAFSGLAIVAAGNYARSADIAFLCANALQSSMKELIPEFEKASGHNVKVTYANLGVITERVRKGETADLAIVSPQQWESLQKDGKVAPTVRVVVGRVGMGVFVKKGAARPDISSVDAFKRAVVNARSIAVGDPTRGSPVGAYMIPLFDRLGISGDIKSKIQLTAGGFGSFEPVIKGDAEMGFSQMSEIIASPQVDLVGSLPTDIQTFTIYTAAIPANAKQAAAAKALIEFLTSARAVSVFKSKGLQPG